MSHLEVATEWVDEYQRSKGATNIGCAQLFPFRSCSGSDLVHNSVAICDWIRKLLYECRHGDDA
jgi:hypothetical protein